MRWSRVIVPAAALLAGACSTGPADPLTHGHELLRDANDVLDEGRVQRALYYVQEALPIFEQSSDKAGLAEAYRLYGLVALYGGLSANATIVLRDLETPLHPATEELDLADRYFLRALPLFEEAGDYFAASNVDFLLARDYAERGVPQQSCAYFDGAIALYDKGKAALPGAEPRTSKGFEGTARDGFVNMKKQAGCTTL